MGRSPRGARAGWVAWRGRGGRLLAGLLAAGALGGVARAAPGLVELVSRGVTPSDTAGGLVSAVSADGRYVVFEAAATNLVPGQVDGGQTFDVFLHDRVTGTTTLVSRTAASPVTSGNGESFGATLSADGRFVAFRSGATDLVAGQVDANEDSDIFLFDRVAGTTTLVSRTASSAVTAGNGGSRLSRVSADGAFVVFQSQATNLVAGQVDVSDTFDIFLYDRVAGTTTLVSRTAASPLQAGDRASESAVLSGNAEFVAFHSQATNLVAGQVDGNNALDVFLYDRAAGTTALVSRAAGTLATAGSAASFFPVLSADGAFVAFPSLALDLVAGQVDVNNRNDVFVYDRAAGTTALVSRAAGTLATTGNGISESSEVSADGASVVFRSQATDLVTGQADANDDGDDVFRYDRVTGTMTLVSRTAGSAATTGNGRSGFAVLSADGAVVAFDSVATDLVTGVADLNGLEDVFVLDVGAGAMTVLSRRDPVVPGASAAGESFLRRAAASADGRFVVFESASENLVAGQVDANVTTDVFLYDRLARTTTLVSRAAGSAATTGDAGSESAVISADGRFVAFESDATDLVAGQVDGNGDRDVFLYDRIEGTTTLVSRAFISSVTAGNGQSRSPVISADGQFVAFEGVATDLVENQADANGTGDVFLYSRVAETTILVSRTAAAAAVTGNGFSGSPAVSADGRFVAFQSSAIDLVTGQIDANGTADVFLYDRVAATTILVSRTAASAVTTGNGFSNIPALSADGGFVAFRSGATDLVAGLVDGNGTGADVFLYDRIAETTTLVSRTPGSAVSSGNAFSGSELVVSADGRFVAFLSAATDLVGGQVDASGTADVFLFDREAGTTTLVSRAAGSAGTTGNGDSESPSLSADGRFVAFQSRATDLVAGQADGNGDLDVFLYDRDAGTTTLVSRSSRVGARRTATTGNGFSESSSLSADGTVVAFSSGASDLTADDDVNGLVDVFVLARPCADRSEPRPCPGAASRPPR